MLMLHFDLFLQSLKLPLLFSFLFLIIKGVQLLLLLLTLLILCVLVLPVTTLSISSQKNSSRAASVPPSYLPSSIVVSSANSLNWYYVARTKPLSFKATKYLVPKFPKLVPLKTSICINPSASGTVSDGAVSDSTNTS